MSVRASLLFFGFLFAYGPARRQWPWL